MVLDLIHSKIFISEVRHLPPLRYHTRYCGASHRNNLKKERSTTIRKYRHVISIDQSSYEKKKTLDIVS